MTQPHCGCFLNNFFPYLINSWSFFQLIDDNPQLIGLFVACQNSNFKIYLDCLNIYLKILSNFFLTWECYAPSRRKIQIISHTRIVSSENQAFIYYDEFIFLGTNKDISFLSNSQLSTICVPQTTKKRVLNCYLNKLKQAGERET